MGIGGVTTLYFESVGHTFFHLAKPRHCFLHPPLAFQILVSFLEHPPLWSLPLISCCYLIPPAECLVSPILMFLHSFPKHLDACTQLFLKYFTLGFFSHKYLTDSSGLLYMSLEPQWAHCTSDYKADRNSDLWIRSSRRRVALGENVGWSFNSHTDSVCHATTTVKLCYTSRDRVTRKANTVLRVTQPGLMETWLTSAADKSSI